MNQSNMDEAILAGQLAKRQQIKKIILVILGLVAVSGVSWGLVSWISNSSSPDDTQVTSNDTEQTTFANESAQQQLRETMQVVLADTDRTLSEIESHNGKVHWNNRGIEALRNQLQLAYGHYSAEEYVQARAQLDAVLDAITEFNQEHEKAWNDSWQKALQAFEQQEITSARLHNQQTLRLNPGLESARQLQQKLDSWDELVAQKEALRIAEIENNVPGQITALKQLALLDSENPMHNQQLGQLLEKQQSDAFGTRLKSAINALKNGRLTEAQEFLDQAQKIDATRHELTHVQSQIHEQQKIVSQQNFEQQIMVMSQVDNWPAVLKLSKSALQAHPKHASFNENFEKAKKIIGLNQQVTQYLSRPERLSDANIANNAGGLLLESQQWFQLSPSLAGKANELQIALESNNQPIDVVIYSDGKTDIRVLGTGVVGKVREKVIRLIPGNYRLEGRRAGYQSKIVELTVHSGSEPVSVQLICDEKI